ncbi:MAG: SCO family protein [Rhodocyclales bacterium]|nr:SCO family protein [Rhodocyclales bacterium]
MTRSPVLAFLAGMLWVSGLVAAAGLPTDHPRSMALGGDFELTDVQGKPFRLADHRGKVILLYFGYTGCPDACPADLLLYRELLARLGPRKDGVLPLFISVDPARDTPRQLADYVRHFSPDILALTGSEQRLLRVARAYGASFRYVGRERDTATYTVDHTISIFLLDPRGRLAGVIPFGTPLEEVQRRVEAVLIPAAGSSARLRDSRAH